MLNRRKFIYTGGLATLGLSMGWPSGILSSPFPPTFTSRRPPVPERKFTSEAVEKTISRTKAMIKDEELAWMFENCYPNTLDTTIKQYSFKGKPDAFVITGDIDAMWLRDSTAQVWPYIPLVREDPDLSLLIQGVINRQTRCVLIDPYANAFNEGLEMSPEHVSDITDMKPGVFERKWEVDSLCYVIRLAYQYWKTSGNTAPFNAEWASAMKQIVNTFKEQQRKSGDGPYSFQRVTSIPYDTAQGRGKGNPVKPTGLICSVFRPSDDSAVFPFLIPSNYFAVQSLMQLAYMSDEILQDTNFTSECLALASEVMTALNQYAVVVHPEFGKVFAYEVDGFGSMLFMDDANVPDLLSLPYIAGIHSDNEVYQNTRRMILSEFNPYYEQGKYSGIGGPHSGQDMIWPLSYIMRAMTSLDEEEIRYCIQMLKETHSGTGFIHESFHKDDPTSYTRSWFAWANTIFGELILKLVDERKMKL